MPKAITGRASFSTAKRVHHIEMKRKKVT